MSRQDVERVLEPVMRSNALSTERLSKELVPIKEEIQTLNKRFGNDITSETQKQSNEKELPNEPNIVQRYYENIPNDQLDKYFGVIMKDHRYKMGSEYVQIIDNKVLLVGNELYLGTIGLWSLIMKKKPSNYTQADLDPYRELVSQTNVMSHPNNLSNKSRITSTKKWLEILSRFAVSHETVEGSGVVQYLPSDIKGMEERLNLLLGEYASGNRSYIVRNEIVSILDELLR